MNPREERKLYIDFARYGGVVESSPIRVLPELVFTGKTRSQLDIELEQHAKMVQETLGESAYLGLGLRKTASVARSIFIDLSLPFSGLTELQDNFYTGWFYTYEKGKIYSAFRNRKEEGISSSPYVNLTTRSPYFLLDKTEAESWNERIKKEKSLTVEGIDSLFLHPGIRSHPFFEEFARLNLKDLTHRVAPTLDSFWNVLKTFGRDDRSAAKREFLRDNLLNLEILQRIHRSSHRIAQAEIKESMEKSEITVFPLGDDGCVVRYISDLEDRKDKGSRLTTTKTLPLPHNLLRHFQRYGRLGERPMTNVELEALYRRLVDPNTKLSF